MPRIIGPGPNTVCDVTIGGNNVKPQWGQAWSEVCRRVPSLPSERVVASVGLDELQKARVGMIRLFNPEYQLDRVPAFESLRQAYKHLTGDESVIFTHFNPERCSAGLRSCMDFNSGSFTYALENALNVYISKAYRDPAYREEILISNQLNAKDYRPIHGIQLGYLGELPDVDTETADIPSIEEYADSEIIYSIGKKAAIVYVTHKHIVNDEIGLIEAMVARLARAARLRHARFAWNFYINNSTCSDGTAWFTSTHGNLGATALSVASLVAGVTALVNLTEPGPSGERIGLDLAAFEWHLVVSLNNWDTAAGFNQLPVYFASNDLTTMKGNPIHHLFGEKNERIITPPFLSDDNNWGIIRNNKDVPLVEMSYLNGKVEPDIIHTDEKDEPGIGSDKIGYKIRHEYGGGLADYRGAYKAVV